MQIFQLLGIFVSKRISNGFIWIYPTYFKLLSYFNIVIFTFTHNPLGYTTIKSSVCYDFHGYGLIRIRIFLFVAIYWIFFILDIRSTGRCKWRGLVFSLNSIPANDLQRTSARASQTGQL